MGADLADTAVGFRGESWGHWVMSKIGVMTVVVGLALGCGLVQAQVPMNGASGAAPARSERQFRTLDDAALAMAREWQAGRKAKPIIGDDGIIRFPFGQTMPTLTCSRMRVCDVEMQGGEKINDVVLGDTINWTWAPSESTEKGQTVQHVVIQPRDLSVETNAIITTNRRTYHLRFRAIGQEGVYLNRVGFYYPEELVSSWDSRAKKRVEEKAESDNLRVSEPVDPTMMDYDYSISGDGDFKPVRVFNNGKQVYLEFAPELYRREMPSLELLDSDGKTAVVNYRTRAKTGANGQVDKIFVIVDKLADRMVLRLGKESVMITWGKHSSRWSWFGSNN